MNKIVMIFLRYLITIALSVNSLWIFYIVFTPLTLYPSYFVLNAIYGASLEHSTIIINGNFISLVDACIAGAAYFLLTALNLLTPGINIKKRMLMLMFEYSAFLIANILRILILSMLLLNGFSYFKEAHLISWHLISAVFVIAIWTSAVKIFKIKEIPFYSDFVCIKNLRK